MRFAVFCNLNIWYMFFGKRGNFRAFKGFNTNCQYVPVCFSVLLEFRIIYFVIWTTHILNMESRNTKIYQLWVDIQDIIGPAHLWPVTIRRLFWTRPLGHWDIILICAFSYVNGLNPEVLIEWIQLLSLVKNDSTIRHMQSFFALIERGRNYSLYAWNVLMWRYEWLDGRPRIYLNRERR